MRAARIRSHGAAVLHLGKDRAKNWGRGRRWKKATGRRSGGSPAIGFAFLSQASPVTSPELSVPFEVILVGGAMSLLLTSANSLLFNTGGTHPTGTG
ncbi:MAG TPA: hypothetical protein VLW25_16525 [Bryobacteraceae bacterium]|nr:hypothetical protein [Bryobacteraceae bacterium]